MAIPFRVDGSRVHLGQVRSTAEVEAGWRRLSCIGGCDLSRVAMYEALTGEQLSDADDASLCPAFYRPMRPLAVIPAVLTN